jgi:sugar lactone lactonase YvrE
MTCTHSSVYLWELSMKPYDLETVLHIQNPLGEGPRWNAQEQRLYWVDIDSGLIYMLDPQTSLLETHAIGQPLGCLAFRSSGNLLLAARDGLAFWNPGKPLQWIASPEQGKVGARFNDGVVDRQGRFWAGTMTESGATSSLYRLDSDGSLQRMESGVMISNGIGWSPDNRTMYYCDSPTNLIYSYDFDPAGGTIANRRVFINNEGNPGVPDGLVVDREGCVWCAHCFGGKVVRYDPDGRTIRTIHLPTSATTACTFGGKNLDELYITTSLRLLTPAQRLNEPAAGDLFRVQTDVQGLPEPFFLG